MPSSKDYLAQDIFFFVSIEPEKSGSRKVLLKPLDDQYVDRGDVVQNIRNHKNVVVKHGSKSILNDYPAGTIFYSTDCTPSMAYNEVKGQLAMLVEPIVTIPYKTVEDYTAWQNIDMANYATPGPHETERLTALSTFTELLFRHNTKTGPAVDPTKSQFSGIRKDTEIYDLMVKHKCPTIEDDGFYVSEETWASLLANWSDNINTMLVGPTGVGKTELLQLLCTKMGSSAKILDMSSMQDAVGGLLGVHRLMINENGDQVSKFDLAPLPVLIQRNRGSVIFDEISRAKPEANNILFPLLDDRREMYLDLASSDTERVIKCGDNIRFMSTANIGAEYTGTEEIDRALQDRFMIVEIGYLEADIEINLLMKVHDIGVKEATAIVRTAQSIRRMAAEGDLSTAVGTRFTKRAAKRYKKGFTLQRSMEDVFTPLFEGTKTEGERSQIYTIIKSL